MKKIVCSFLMILLLVLTLTACNNIPKDTTPSSPNTQDPVQNPNDNIDEEQESPIEDFQYIENQDGGITITRYIGDDERVIVPTMIDGKNVTIIGTYCFSSSNIKTVYVKLPDTVTTIGFQAFYQNATLTTIVLPEGLTKIDSEAFAECTSLSNITLPNSLTIIGDSAFQECTSLKSINLPKGCISGKSGYAVFYLSGLESIEIPEGTEYIPYGLLACTNIKEVVLPSTVTKIASDVFCGCKNLESVKLNEGLVELGSRVFGDTKITEITIPKSVVKIDEDTFDDCDVLEKVIFEGDAPDQYLFDEWTIIGPEVDYTIYYHSEAKGFTYPRWNGYRTEIIGVANEAPKVFGNFEYVENLNGGITILKYWGNDTELVIPEQIDGKNVTEIGTCAFRFNESLISVTIPNTVTDIFPKAFDSCDSLTTVVLSQNLTSIGLGAFNYCQLLSNVTLPSSLTTLGDNTFKYCTSLKHINIPKGIKEWGEGAFSYSDIETIDFEEGLEKIGAYAFSNTKITNIELPQSVKIVEVKAFVGCDNLETIKLNEGLVTIEENAFYGARKLTDIVIPKSVKTMSHTALEGCKKLTGIYFEGNCPEGFAPDDVYNTPNIYYHDGATGFDKLGYWCITIIW